MRLILTLLMVLLLSSSADAQGVALPDNPFGLGWGAAVGLGHNLSSDLVPEGGAFIDPEGIVRVVQVSNVAPRMLLESHFTWSLSSTVAMGPAMVVQPGENLFDAAGIGILIELGNGERSFNLIVGAMLDFSVTRLGRGFRDGQPAPTPELIYVDREELSLLLATGIGF